MKVTTNEHGGIETEMKFSKYYGGYMITLRYVGKEITFLGYESKTKGSWRKNAASGNALCGMDNLIQYVRLFNRDATEEEFIEKFKELMKKEDEDNDTRKKSFKDS